MNIKQTIVTLSRFFILAVVLASSATVLNGLFTQTTKAYTCEYADLTNGVASVYNDGQKNDDDTGLNPSQIKYVREKQTLRYENGACHAKMVDIGAGNKDDSATKNAKGEIVHCATGDEQYDGHCWAVKDYSISGMLPNKDDGSQMSKDEREKRWVCKDGGQYHAASQVCQKEECFGIKPVAICSIKTYNPTEEVKDETTSTVNDCTQTGATFNRTTHSCNWTPDTCGKSSQGVWVNNSCKKYSDYTNQADCEKVGGEWKDGACVKPGTNGNQPGTSTPNPSSAGNPNNTDNEGDCGGARTVLIPGNCGDKGIPAIGSVLKLVINILTVGIGIVAVGGIIYGAILYTSARDNAGQTQQAIGIIRTVVIGLLLYIFMISLLNWLVPGGVIG